MLARSRPSGRWLVPSILMLSACVSSPASPAPNQLPEAPLPPAGWSSVGATQGEASPVWSISRLAFSGRRVAVHATCLGNGMLFVIVEWKAVSVSAGPGAFPTAVLPCDRPIGSELTTRIELPTAPSGAADVAVFVLESAGTVGGTSFGVSIEEQDP